MSNQFPPDFRNPDRRRFETSVPVGPDARHIRRGVDLAASMSIAAPAFAFFLQPVMAGMGRVEPIAAIVVGVIQFLVMVVGLILGIVSLLIATPVERQQIAIRAWIGIAISGGLLLLGCGGLAILMIAKP